MKKICMATVALSALLVAPALSADMAPRPYTKAPPMMMEPAYNWSGFYIGVNAGYTFGDREDIRTTGQAQINQTNVVNNFRPALVRQTRDGFIGSGQMGYNWQVSPTWVLGFETDIQ